MALEQRYLIEFKDFLSLDWSIQIWQDLDADPGLTTLIATGNPLNIEYNSDSDEFNESVRTSKAVINVYSETDFLLTDLFVVEDLKSPVYIYQGADLYWKGYVLAGEYSEPYKDVPYPVTITAVDGLSLLKSMPYKYTVTELDDTFYNGRMLISQILVDIAAKINFFGFTEYVNLFEANMFQTVDDSPFDQSYLDVDIFRDMYCFEVMQETLKPFNAVARQIEGKIVIYRPIELSQPVMYGRDFTNATLKGSVSYIPGQSINRIATPSDIWQFPGSDLMVKGPAKKILLTHDYGYKDSWIDNDEFAGDTYGNIAAAKFDNWTSGDSLYPVGNVIPGEKDGVLLTTQSSAPPHNAYVTQTFATNAIHSSTDAFGFEFDYLFNLTTASNILANITLYIEVTNTDTEDGQYWLTEDNEEKCKWMTSQHYVEVHVFTLAPGSSGWATYKRKFIGLPVDGPYKITIWGAYSDGSIQFTTGVKNIKFYSSSVNIVTMNPGFLLKRKTKGWIRSPLRPREWITDFVNIVSKEYQVTNAVNGKELSYEYMIGDVIDAEAGIDNVIEQFAGAIAVTSSLINSEAWSTRYPGGEGDPIIEVAGGEIGRQYSRPTQFIQMEIQEMDATAPVLNIMGSFSDSLNTYKGVPRKFLFNAGEYNVKRRLWSADLLELVLLETDPNEDPGTGYGPLYNWYAVTGVTE